MDSYEVRMREQNNESFSRIHVIIVIAESSISAAEEATDRLAEDLKLPRYALTLMSVRKKERRFE